MTKTLIEWQEPKAVRIQTSKKQLKGCWKKVTRVMAVAAILIAIVYFALKQFPLEENFFKLFPPIHLIAVFFILIMIFVIYPFLIRFMTQIYAFTEKGINFSGNKNGFCSWDNITDYSIEDSTDFPELKTMTIIYKGRERILYLSDDVSIEKILTILSTRITKRPTEVKTKLSFTKTEYLYIFIFCFACSALLAYFVLYQKILGHYMQAIFILLFFGPGNLVIIQLKGFKTYKSSDAPLWSYMLNLLTLFACIIIGLVYAYIKAYKIFN